MGRPTNKEKYIKSIYQLIEQSNDTYFKDVYVCLLKERIDAYNKDYKTLLYDKIYSVLDGLYDIKQKLNIVDEDNSLVIENIKAVLQQKYWSMYMDTLLKETLIYEGSPDEE